MSRQGRPKSERKQRTRKESFLPSEKIKVMCEAVRQDMGERGITVEDVVKDTGFSLNSVKRYLCSTITESFILCNYDLLCTEMRQTSCLPRMTFVLQKKRIFRHG